MARHQRPYTPHGAALDLFGSHEHRFVLLEGPAGTGKTRAALQYADTLSTVYPGSRGAFLRKTLKSLKKTVLPIWEQEVLWRGHPAIPGHGAINSRDYYSYPNASKSPTGEGSWIDLFGLDEPDKIMSGQYDWGIFFEAHETGVRDFEQFATRLRYPHSPMPFKQLVCDTNPSFAHCYLNRWAKAGKMCRLKSKLQDNPIFFDHAAGDWTVAGKDYLKTLEHLTGAQRKRLLDGDWVTAEGMVFEDYDPDLHILAAKIRHDAKGTVWVDVPWGQAERCNLIPAGINGDGTGYWSVEMQWFIGSKDFGWNAPGCFQVWGVNGKGQDQKVFRLAEIYHTKRQYDWWAEEIAKLREEFPFNRVICDSAEPRGIELINDRLTSVRGRKVDRIVSGADKSTRVGGRNYQLVSLDQMRWLLSPDNLGPRMFLVADALRIKDKQVALAEMPTCLEEELAGFVLEETEDGKPIRENPDQSCPNHAIDAAKYMAMHVWRKDLTPQAKPARWRDKKGTLGQLYDHDILERQELGMTEEEWLDAGN